MADPEEEGPRETEPVLVPEPKPTRSVAATVTDVPWLADVEQMRKRVLAEAESLRGEARGHYENLSTGCEREAGGGRLGSIVARGVTVPERGDAQSSDERQHRTQVQGERRGGCALAGPGGQVGGGQSSRRV